ncbi:DUF1281 family ferredoxin-like fold protein [Mucilaginibacter gilvus]|uniref:YubB ferredoxin-like domain-containing protein n=1 Tax=Mucilaginibacter gilvus TaxID=2305909 RepID=A0A444MI96_9SPHI|nr:hypothetical protein [Mucilaginibacter gilvus]RWY47381.1 hypothetical protein EPL05_22050 [Mucilaginibacter gilvus]
MANWCSNSVEFIGEHSQFEQLTSLFQAMAKKEKKEERGQLPTFVKEERGHLFCIRWEDGILNYETKWAPNTNIIVQIADKFGVGFKLNYTEPGMEIFGESTYTDGCLEDICLDNDDTSRYEYNEDDSTYRFENQNYECSEEIQEILLERKKAIKRLQDLDPTNNN